MGSALKSEYTAGAASECSVRMPAAVMSGAVTAVVGRDRAGDMARVILAALHDAGYRICVRSDDDRAATRIVGDAIAQRLQVANVVARGAAGWVVHDLHDRGWRLLEVDPP
jgi:phage tail sheath gpL-like